MNNALVNVNVNSEGRVSRADAQRLLAAKRARAAHAEDIRRAENLRKSRSIANVKPGTGPRIAR